MLNRQIIINDNYKNLKKPLPSLSDELENAEQPLGEFKLMHRCYPDEWEESFDSFDALVGKLDSLIASSCVIDAGDVQIHDGYIPKMDYQCMTNEQKLIALLSTSTGCEYSVCENTEQFISGINL